MKPFDPNGGDDPVEWKRQLDAWRKRQAAAAQEQSAARTALDAAQVRASTLDGWVNRLTAIAAEASGHSSTAATIASGLTSTESELTTAQGLLRDHREAREIATARAMQGPPTSTPIVLLPLRLQTAWLGGALTVRIYPSDLGVDRHDPRLSDAETRLAETYWATRALPQAEQDTQAWQELVRRVGGPRAAWIVRTTDPSAPPPAQRDSAWDVAVTTALLPDRFAVIAYHAGEPIDIGEGGTPRYVTWGAPVPDRLPLSTLPPNNGATWTTDITAALDKGMAVTIPVPAGAPPIDELVVVGLRTRSGNLADLLDAHALSVGLELFPDGTPTNNSAQIRAAHSPARDEQIAASLVDPDRPTQCSAGSGGAQVAALLGIPDGRVAAVHGAQRDRGGPAAAMAALVGAAAQGPLRQQLGPDGSAAWAQLWPSGPAPTMRVGRQPYGVLPATAPSRWAASDSDSAAPLAPLLRRWARTHAAPVDVDPADPPAALPKARTVTRDDESALAALLLESASSLAWTADGVSYTNLDGLVGPADGTQAPAAYLAALADTTDANLPAVAAGLPHTLLARLALNARTQLGAAPTTGVLHALARLATQDSGREDLARLLTATLDALSHRVDAWVTAAAASRVLAQRSTSTPPTPAVGAYGYLTNVAHRSEPRTTGHIHAPSLAHAATAAVLRSGYLGRRRAAWAAKLHAAQANARRSQQRLDAWESSPEGRRGIPPAPDLVQSLALASHQVTIAQAGLTQSARLDAATEADLPMAIDLSSARVREARKILRAVREGQPLAAMLGYLLERDLTDADLQQYITPLRKLTRFHTGTALEGFESARRDAQAALATDQQHLQTLRQAVADTDGPIAVAGVELAKAQAGERAAKAAEAGYQKLEEELAALETTIYQDGINLADAIAGRRQPGTRHKTINVPD